MLERTLVMVKPDAVKKHVIGKIISQFEDKGLKVVAMKMRHFSHKEAEKFYAVHNARPFFKDLVGFMTMGPLVAVVLEGENAVKGAREIMGATDPAKADHGTIRKNFGADVEKNAVHGSDSLENAALEIAFHFSQTELVG